jgi:hypothetical protein
MEPNRLGRPAEEAIRLLGALLRANFRDTFANGIAYGGYQKGHANARDEDRHRSHPGDPFSGDVWALQNGYQCLFDQVEHGSILHG